MAAAKGNQYAAKERRFVAMLQRVLEHEGDGNSLRRIALKLIECAEEGQSWAISEVANRLDGRPAQALELSGDVGNRTHRDMSDEELLRIAAQAQAVVEHDGETIN